MATFDALKKGIEAYHAHAVDKGKARMVAYAATVERQMQQDHAHGNVSGAAEAGYRCVVVGRGDDSASAVASAVAAVEALKPGKSATASASVPGVLGALYFNTASYQICIETEHAVAGATLTPTFRATHQGLTRAFAEGARA